MKKQYKLILFLFALLVIVQFTSIQTVSASCQLNPAECCLTDDDCSKYAYDACSAPTCDIVTGCSSPQTTKVCPVGQHCELPSGDCFDGSPAPTVCGDDKCDFGEDESCPTDCPTLSLCLAGETQVDSCTGTYNTTGTQPKIDWNGADFDWILRDIYYNNGSLAATCSKDDVGVGDNVLPSGGTCTTLDGEYLMLGSNYWTPYTTGNWKALIISAAGDIGDGGSFGSLYGTAPIISNDCSGLLFKKLFKKSLCDTKVECTWSSTCTPTKTLDLTTCTTTPISDDTLTGNSSIQGNSTITEKYNDGTFAEVLNRTDSCLDSSNLTEYYCSGTSLNHQILNRTVTCGSGYECSAGACVVSGTSTSTSTGAYWVIYDDTSLIVSEAPTNVNSTKTYRIKLVVDNPDLKSAGDFNLYEKDYSPDTDELVATLTSSQSIINSKNVLIANYTFTTSILNLINNSGDLGNNGYEFYFIPSQTDFPNLNSSILKVYISETTPPCLLRKTHVNKAGACILTSTPRLAWINSSFPRDEILPSDTVIINPNNLYDQKFIMAYMQESVSSNLNFQLEGFNNVGIWQELGPSITGTKDSDGDLLKEVNLKYSDFWDLGFDSSQKDYSFRFKINNEVSQNLTIKFSGTIPICTDESENGAEDGVDCGGECGGANGGSTTCNTICLQSVNTCGTYKTNSACSEMECLDQSNDGATCEWNNNACQTKKVGLSGTCYYTENPATDDCVDGIYSYGYTTNFVWNQWVIDNNVTSADATSDFVNVSNVYYYDPNHESSSCIDGYQAVACSAQVKLTFWTWQNILASVGLIFLGYYILGIKRPKKKLVKKKNSKKKATKKSKK